MKACSMLQEIIVNNKIKTMVDNRNMKSFSPLPNYDIECYKCHNFSHKT